MRGRRAVVRALGAGALVVLAGCGPLYLPWPDTPVTGPPDPASTLIGCDRAETPVTVTADSRLDPTCEYHRTFTISTSGVTLDCQGARIVDVARNQGQGIRISTPISTPLADVTVRNCFVEGFLNNIRVLRLGFRDDPRFQGPNPDETAQYEHTTSDITIERSWLFRSRGSGIFVDGYTADVTMRELQVQDSGGVAIYLEAGSKDNLIEDSTLVGNGFKDTGPEGVPFVVGGVEFRYISTGREAIAIDGSRNNIVRNNAISGSSNGGILLYKNCGEFVSQPGQWWTRYYGADGNLIEGNLILDARQGIWVGSRMAENQLTMDCSDPKYLANPVVAYHLDYAQGNTIRDNVISGAPYGIRIEDDNTLVEGNTIVSGSATHEAVLVGTKIRSEQLGRPTTGTVIRDNVANISGNATPFRSIPSEASTTFTGNVANGAPASLVPGTQPPIDPFLMVKTFWLP